MEKELNRLFHSYKSHSMLDRASIQHTGLKKSTNHQTHLLHLLSDVDQLTVREGKLQGTPLTVQILHTFVLHWVVFNLLKTFYHTMY